ncbi:transporter substrate-binding domain-containing protein [Microbacter sp. GSS18]|nr:transporter substrate-binding domain-containing protein [Microbacter sp. GSS18]
MTGGLKDTRRGRVRRAAGFALLSGVLVTSLVACASANGTENADAEPAADADVIQEAFDALPDDIKESGVLKAASSFDYGPFAYLEADSGDRAGFDYDAVNAIASRIGLEVEWTTLGTFESLIPAAQSGQADAVVDGMGIIEERLGAVSFVYMMNADNAILVQAGNPANVDPADMCGSHLTTAPSGLQAIVFEEESAKCVADGKEPIEVSLLADTAAASAGVLAGQFDGQGWGTATGNFSVRANPDFEVTDPIPGYATPNGIILQDSDRGEAIGNAFVIALQSMMDDGTLQEIADANTMGSDVPTQTFYVRTPDQLEELLASDPALQDG